MIISYTLVCVRQLIETLELSTLFFSYQQQLSAKNLVFCTQEGDWRQIFLQTKDKLFSTHHRTAPSFTLQGWSTESWNRLVTLGHTHSCPFATQTFRNEIGDGGKFFRLTVQWRLAALYWLRDHETSPVPCCWESLNPV